MCSVQIRPQTQPQTQPQTRPQGSSRAAVAAAAWVCATLLPAAGQAADNSSAAVPGISEGWRFDEADGESLYRAICQGCHMPDGKGAQGAGMYPALAGNAKLAAGAYPIYTVLNGRKGMPGFKTMLSDAQVAEVTNYVRTHLGNSYKDAVTAADVKSLR